MPDNPSSTAWAEPGVVEVAPGVHRMPLPLPDDALRAVNVYALETADGLVMIDAGWSVRAAREQLEDGLRSLGAGPSDISRFLVTHSHRDHYGMAVAVRAEFGTRVEIGLGERPSLERLVRPDLVPLSAQLDHMTVLGAGELAEKIRAHLGHGHDPDAWTLPDAWIVPGPIRLPGGRTLDAVETPGHTRGHVVFHDLDAGLLFAGDHVLPRITPSIGFEAAPTASPLAAFMQSLALLLDRPDAVLLPAHGPVAPSVHARVHELLDHHEHRLADMATAVAGGASTVFDVATAVTWTRRQRSLDSLDGFNQMLAIFETAAHLEVLRARGAVLREDRTGLWWFTSRRD